MLLRALRGAFRSGLRPARESRASRRAPQAPQQVRLSHWREADLNRWRARWPHFAPREVASRGDGSLRVSTALLDFLERLRAELGGRPLAVTSCYRDPLHNARVGGAPLSRHKVSDACDIRIGGHDRRELAGAAEMLGARGIGRYINFIHVDLRPGRPARWYGSRAAREAWGARS